MPVDIPATNETGDWHVLWTRSNCEKRVAEHLAKKGYETFLPMINQWVAGSERSQRPSAVPMFKGYVFLKHAIDKHAYIDIVKSRGLVRILGSRWDRLDAVPAEEIEAIRKTVESDLPVSPWQFLEAGDRVRIKHGPLANSEGVYLESNAAKGLFIISVSLLKRSVAVEIDCTHIEPL